MEAPEAHDLVSAFTNVTHRLFQDITDVPT